MLLNQTQIAEAMHSLPGWTTDGKCLLRTYTFDGFPEAVAFVNQLVAPSEAQNHHPDIAISYNRVTLTLTTHDSGGLTAKDLTLARALST